MLKTAKSKKTVKSSKASKSVTTPKAAKSSVISKKSWADVYTEKSAAIDRLLWSSRHCGKLRGGSLGKIKEELKESGPDGLLALGWLGSPHARNQLVKDLQALLNS